DSSDRAACACVARLSQKDSCSKSGLLPCPVNFRFIVPLPSMSIESLKHKHDVQPCVTFGRALRAIHRDAGGLPSRHSSVTQPCEASFTLLMYLYNVPRVA